MECCGVLSATDYTKVPSSCCKDKTTNACDVSNAFTKGCLKPTLDLFDYTLKMIVYVALGICAIEVRIVFLGQFSNKSLYRLSLQCFAKFQGINITLQPYKNVYINMCPKSFISESFESVDVWNSHISMFSISY